MIKICFIRGCRIVLMLVAIALLSIVALFSVSPDISFLEAHVEHKIGKAFNTDKVDIAFIKMGWNSGPVFDLGKVNLASDTISLHGTHLVFSYSTFQLFRAAVAPVVSLAGGEITINLDADSKAENASVTSPANVTTKLENVQINWIYQQETQSIYHADAEIAPFASNLSLEADGLELRISLADDALPETITLNMIDFSMLPKSWSAYIQGLTELSLTAKRQGQQTWSWQSQVQAGEDKGLLAFDDVHIRIPFASFAAQGDVQLDIGKEGIALVAFEASDVQWKNGNNYGDFNVSWQQDMLHIDALDGSTAAPLLWSWLWPIGGDLFHQWLDSMRHGRISNVRAKVDLDWVAPLKQAPTLQNLLDMKYHVTARAHDVDIALGLEGDYLYHIAGDVLVDEHHLQAKVRHAVLNDGLGVVAGDYQINWDTLRMDVNATGQVDVGALHTWLDPESAAPLVWGDAPASAEVYLAWDLDENEPQDVVVSLVPVDNQVWHIAPKGIAMTVESGQAVWDYKRGLDLKDMQVSLPWLKGDLTVFIDKNKDWALQEVVLDAYAPLADLTDTFVLPIVNPQGMTKALVKYNAGQWSGYLDLSANDWDNFIGFDKQGLEQIKLPFTGRQLGDEILPIRIDSLQSKHKEFLLKSTFDVDKNHINFAFHDVVTAAFKGDMKLMMPLDVTLPWSFEVDAAYMDKPVLSRYLKDNDDAKQSERPWSVVANIDKVAWEKSYAEQVSIKFSSDETSLGQVHVAHFVSVDADLEQLKADFTLHGLGDYELHLFEARGAGQLLQASGSVKTQADGSLRWQGLALMGGEFGTLMKQAELDKLFREGDMAALFLGHGEYKDGEPWWREMKGGFKLRVNDGRIMEGGTLTRLLAAISIVDLPKYLILDRGDVVGDGLLYDKLQVEGSFVGHKLNIDQLGFLSSALDAGGTGEVDLETGELDIVLVARPWQNIEVFISKVPLLGSILTGEDQSILRKIYRIHGPASDANVDEIDAEEAGLPSGGYLEDLFAPSKWFEPKQKVKAEQ